MPTAGGDKRRPRRVRLFPHPPPAGHDLPDEVAPPGVVPRWAMTEALTRVLEKAGVELPEVDPESVDDPYPDVGWLSPSGGTYVPAPGGRTCCRVGVP